MLHESAHNFNYLADGVASGNAGLWPAEIQAAAKQTVSRYRLAGGLTAFWSAMHGTGVEVGVAGPYGPASASPVARGFASPYRGTGIADDIAEYVANLQAPDNAGSALCKAFAASQGPLGADLALPYAKSKLLESVGLVDPARFEACMAGTAISDAIGIHLGDAISFTDGLKAGFLDQDGGHFAAVLGSGPKGYDLLLRVLSPDEQPITRGARPGRVPRRRASTRRPTASAPRLRRRCPKSGTASARAVSCRSPSTGRSCRRRGTP